MGWPFSPIVCYKNIEKNIIEIKKGRSIISALLIFYKNIVILLKVGFRANCRQLSSIFRFFVSAIKEYLLTVFAPVCSFGAELFY